MTLRAAPLLTPLAAALALAGCGSQGSADGPGGATVGEARSLDRAAAMLDQQRLPAETQTEPAASPSPQVSPAPSGP